MQKDVNIDAVHIWNHQEWQQGGLAGVTGLEGL